MLWKNVPVRVTGLLIAGAALLGGPGGHGGASCWQSVPGPAVPAGDSGSLLGVSMPGPASGWAVGFTRSGVNFRPLLARWDGRRWRAARLPAGTTALGRLDGIAALSASNAWAVGGAYTATGNTSAPLIIHWDGRQWARVRAAPVPGYGFTELLGAAAASPSDAWAVGEAANTAGQLRTVTEHWNGRNWALVPSPSLGTLSALDSVAVSGTHRAWAVGGSFAATSRALVLRWTGHTWQRAATPRATNPGLSSVVAVSPNQVWAVGDTPRLGRPDRTYALRWDGHVWRSVPVAAGPGRGGGQLVSVTVLRGGHLAAVGVNLGPAHGALYAGWNGRRWSVASGPLNGTALSAVTTEGHALWAVGSKNQSATTRYVPLVQTCRQ